MSARVRIAMLAAFGALLPLAVTAPVDTANATAAPTSVMAAAAAPATADFPDGVTRLSGVDRYATAVAVAERYSPGVPAVFVATGADFPDALAAASGAAAAGGPLLLTTPTRLPDTVRLELQRLKPARIYIAGGTAVVSTGVETALRRIAPTKRLAGAERYSTAQAIVDASFTSADHAVIATGRTFPDALAATGAAGSRRAPVLLVDGRSPRVGAPTVATLRRLGVRSVTITGGASVVSSGIQSQLTSAGYAVTRYGGTDRYETAALINRAYFRPGSSATSFLATGADFPDALAAAALAGRLGAPLDLTWRSCVPPAVNDGILSVGATRRAVLGGTAVVSRAAAENVRCVIPTTSEPLADWAVSSWDFDADAPAPYSDRPPVDVRSDSITLDSTGLLVYLRIDNRKRADHPVAYAQYGISAMLEYERTGDQIWLDRAIRHGRQLIAIRVERGEAWWYPYRFPWTYYERTLSSPWYSAMAQGQALSLFVRLAEATGETRWETAADKTWTSFTQRYSSTAPWSSLVIDDHLYFEEYAGDQVPLTVLNGQIFAMFGLYDYWRHRGGDPKVGAYLDGGATTVLARMMPAVRVPGGVSYYCVQAAYCQNSRWQHKTYHVIHSWQLDTLSRLTGDDRFSTWAARLRDDWAPADAAQSFERAQDEWMLPAG
ncbi:cell wall-binding repeat-containing protein [Agromyces italicus]|uniref:cell wall-binding repeat-containing protein n=1 Tax=Agromyces italicus TaxID=279572 RepID=UPI0003FA2AC0|nr:cell wall-binding repeat-containing protein [Agromyces italicus]